MIHLTRLAAAALVLTLVTGAATAQSKKETKTAAPSPCAGLEQSACKANSACTWYRETTTRKGQTRKAHCQKKPTRKKK